MENIKKRSLALLLTLVTVFSLISGVLPQKAKAEGSTATIGLSQSETSVLKNVEDFRISGASATATDGQRNFIVSVLYKPNKDGINRRLEITLPYGFELKMNPGGLVVSGSYNVKTGTTLTLNVKDGEDLKEYAVDLSVIQHPELLLSSSAPRDHVFTSIGYNGTTGADIEAQGSLTLSVNKNKPTYTARVTSNGEKWTPFELSSYRFSQSPGNSYMNKPVKLEFKNTTGGQVTSDLLFTAPMPDGFSLYPSTYCYAIYYASAKSPGTNVTVTNFFNVTSDTTGGKMVYKIAPIKSYIDGTNAFSAVHSGSTLCDMLSQPYTLTMELKPVPSYNSGRVLETGIFNGSDTIKVNYTDFSVESADARAKSVTGDTVKIELANGTDFGMELISNYPNEIRAMDATVGYDNLVWFSTDQKYAIHQNLVASYEYAYEFSPLSLSTMLKADGFKYEITISDKTGVVRTDKIEGQTSYTPSPALATGQYISKIVVTKPEMYKHDYTHYSWINTSLAGNGTTRYYSYQKGCNNSKPANCSQCFCIGRAR